MDKIKYKSVSAFSLNTIHIINLPNDKVGVISFPVAVNMVEAMKKDIIQTRISLAVENHLGHKAEMEYDGTSVTVLEGDKVRHPFNDKILTINEYNKLLVDLNEKI